MYKLRLKQVFLLSYKYENPVFGNNITCENLSTCENFWECKK